MSQNNYYGQFPAMPPRPMSPVRQGRGWSVGATLGVIMFVLSPLVGFGCGVLSYVDWRFYLGMPLTLATGWLGLCMILFRRRWDTIAVLVTFFAPIGLFALLIGPGARRTVHGRW